LIGAAAGKAGEFRKLRRDPINDFFLHVIELPFIVHLGGRCLSSKCRGRCIGSLNAATDHCKLSAIRGLTSFSAFLHNEKHKSAENSLGRRLLLER